MKTALIFSDDPAKSFFFKKHLKGLYSILEVASEEEVFAWLASSSIELLFFEIGVLEKDLSSFCEKVHILSPRIPFLFLITPIVRKSFAEEAKKAGVFALLHEPLHAEELEEVIDLALSPSLLSKRLKELAKKLKPPSLIPRNTFSLSNKSIMRNETLKTILEAKKNATPLCIFTLQIDLLDRLKKEFGKEGIVFLSKKVEEILLQNLRQKDFLITEKPGNYLFILPKTSQSAGKIIAEELLREISSTPLSIQNSDILLSVSIGVLSFSATRSSANEAFEELEHSLQKVRFALDSQKKLGKIIVSS